VRLVVEQIAVVNPVLADRTSGVLKELPIDAHRFRYVLKGQIEGLGYDQYVDVIVFPIAALGRGVNIVIRSDDNDSGKAAVGSIYFLTRPHPAAGDLSLMISMLAQATQAFDNRNLSQYSLAASSLTSNTVFVRQATRRRPGQRRDLSGCAQTTARKCFGILSSSARLRRAKNKFVTGLLIGLKLNFLRSPMR
jgi:hypothetical protein